MKPKHLFLSDLCDKNTLFICLCETFLHEGINDNEVQICGHSIIRCDRRDRVGGGVCIYLRHSIPFNICLTYSNSVCDLLIVKLHNPSLIIVAMYRPPSCSLCDFVDVTTKAKAYIMSLPSPLPQLILLGDFNLPDVDWTNPDPGSRIAGPLINLTTLSFISQQVIAPTRGPNLLDLIFCSDDLLTSIDVTDTTLSDHRLITAHSSIPVINPESSQSKNPPSTSFESLDFNKADWPNLRLALTSTISNTTLTQAHATNSYSVSMTHISDVCNKHVPPKGQKRTKITKFHKERKIFMRNRRNVLKSKLAPVKLASRLECIEHSICQSHRQEKMHEEQIAVSKIKQDSNFFFRYAKKFSICKPIIGPLVCKQNSALVLTSDKHEMCCALIEQFNSVFTIPVTDKIVTDPISFFSCESIPPGTRSSYLTDIKLSESIIIDAIHELSPNSAAGPDGVPSSLLVNCAHELAPILLKLFSDTFYHSSIPLELKRAAITPIFKSGDKSLPSNYRPISLTSVISKVLERIIRKQVFEFLTENGCLNSTQHGFRSGRSCLSALLDVFDDIMHMLEHKHTVDMIYLDFSKAFDKVDHGILLHKLRATGITGHLGQWFYNFLTNRTQFVRLPGGISQDYPVLSGVPQGTVLGPLLFLLMIGDINQFVKSSRLVSFADDTRLYSRISNVDDCDSLQHDLNSVYDWATTNNMIFNSQKFNYISFSSNMASERTNVYINPGMNIINPSINVRDLGIQMSSNCSFDTHIIDLSKRCYNLTGWILRTFITRDKLTMLTLFKSIVLSRLDYASQLWSPHKLKHINLIERIQRSFTKHIAGMHDLSYHVRLQKLCLYSVQRRRDRYCILYVWKIIEGLVPNFTNPIVCTFSNRRGRSCIINHVDTGRLGTLAYNSFRWRSIRMFNRLPKCVRDISNCPITSFKNKLDHHLKDIVDLPCYTGFNNSLDGGDCLNGGLTVDDLATK